MGPDQDLIDEVIATFPRTFGLRNHDGVFRISSWDSYFTGPGRGEGRLMLYTERLRDNGEWVSFAKGTESELYNNIVKIPQESLRQKRRTGKYEIGKRRAENYEVVVGNIGSVHEGSDREEAEDVFFEYVEQSKKRFGRASGEDVALFKEDDIIAEHVGRGGGR
jgi:hypothetical protein